MREAVVEVLPTKLKMFFKVKLPSLSHKLFQRGKPEFNAFVDFTSFLIAERWDTELMADPRNDWIETETDVMLQI